MFCQIRVKGHFSPVWEMWFDALVITNEENGEALMTGTLPDQATLFGVLNRLQALNVLLVSVVCEFDTADSSQDSSLDE
jgi:hypothetical protein